MNWTTVVPPLVLGVVALAGVAVAAHRGLFSPAPPSESEATQSAAPLFFGAVGVYLWMALAGLGVMALMGVGKDAPPGLMARAQLAAAGAQVVPALAIAWLACRSARVPRPKSSGWQLVAQGLGWAALLLPAVFAVGVAGSAMSEALGRPVDRTAHVMLKIIANPESDAATRWMLIAVAVVAAPVLEETCYRGLLQRGIARVLRSNLGAVLVTALLFTAMHAPVIPADSLWPTLATLFALALGLGFLTARTGSVVSSMVVHAAFNAVNIAVAVWWMAGPDKQ